MRSYIPGTFRCLVPARLRFGAQHAPPEPGMGRFWVDQQDRQIVKVEVEVIDTISMGLVLVRIAKGSHATLELTSARDGVWLPDRLQIFASARLGLVQVLHIEQTVHYTRYRSVPAEAGAIHIAEGRDAHSDALKQLAKVNP
jgi:hypothetical protein